MSQSSRILIVEDEAEMAYFLKQRLESKGYQVSVAENGQDALNHAAQMQPALMILDVGLPDLSGYDVCERLRKLYPPQAVPVLMLTAKNDPMDKLMGFDHGTDAYLTKPFDLAELEKTIAMLLDR